MSMDLLYPGHTVVRDKDLCTSYRTCAKQCGLGAHTYGAKTKTMRADSTKCINCQRYVTFCPTLALKVVKSDSICKLNNNWTSSAINEVIQQASSGGVLPSSTGNPHNYPIYWDKILINISQVTNPSIDPLEELMETRVFLGKKPGKVECDDQGHLKFERAPSHLALKVPILFVGMSYGAVNCNVHESLARVVEQLSTYYNTGESGLHENLYKHDRNTIVQVALGRFGAHRAYLDAGAAIEIKIGQGAGLGIGRYLPDYKVDNEVSKTRTTPEGSGAISLALRHDIYPIEDLRQSVYSLKEATAYTKPIIVKIAVAHNVAAVASGIARSGTDIIAIGEFRAGTDAAPTRICDNVDVPIELTAAVVDDRLREEQIRSNISLVVSGGIRSSADVFRAIALGAGTVYITTPTLIASGRYTCCNCRTDKYNWGITTQRSDLVERLNPDEGTRRLVDLVSVWQHEIMEMMDGMGINSIEALRGSRLMLRGIELNQKGLDILGIKHTGEQQSTLLKTDPDRSDHPLLK